MLRHCLCKQHPAADVQPKFIHLREVHFSSDSKGTTYSEEMPSTKSEPLLALLRLPAIQLLSIRLPSELDGQPIPRDWNDTAMVSVAWNLTTLSFFKREVTKEISIYSSALHQI